MKPLLVTLSLVAGVGTVWGLQSAQSAAVQPSSDRAIVVVSDLHMGVGRDAAGAWHPYEDFRWDAEFSEFLKAVDAGATGATDLILNGDTFELWQAPDAGCAYQDAALGCTEREALARLDRALTAHDAAITALARFARSRSNRVVFVPGDHDAALLFPGVSRRVVSALGAPAGRVEVAGSGYWLSSDGQVYAEHGHQIGLSAFKLETWPSPFVPRSVRPEPAVPRQARDALSQPKGEGREHLARSWGEQVVQDLYNRLEERYPIVDNVAAAGAGLKYALAADGATGATDDTRLLRYFLFTTPWQQFRMELDDGEVQPPVWDVQQVRAQGAAFLVTALPEDDPFKPLATKALNEGRLANSMDELTEDEIVTICDYRAAVRRARRRFEPAVTQFSPRGPVVAECPRMPDTRGALFDYFWRSRDLIFMRHLEGAARRLPTPARPIAVFVYGHTHLADRSQTGAQMISGGLLKIPMEGFSPVRGALTPNVINGGAWQRTIAPVQLERLMTERGRSAQLLLRSLQPEHLAPCYSFVQIGSGSDGRLAAAVRYWRRSGDGRWEMGGNCGLQPSGI